MEHSAGTRVRSVPTLSVRDAESEISNHLAVGIGDFDPPGALGLAPYPVVAICLPTMRFEDESLPGYNLVPIVPDVIDVRLALNRVKHVVAESPPFGRCEYNGPVNGRAPFDAFTHDRFTQPIVTLKGPYLVNIRRGGFCIRVETNTEEDE